MFKVGYIDIGNDNRFCEFNTGLETLALVERLIEADISTVLDRDDVVIVHDEDLVYEVYAGGCSAGWVAIKSL